MKKQKKAQTDKNKLQQLNPKFMAVKEKVEKFKKEKNIKPTKDEIMII